MDGPPKDVAPSLRKARNKLRIDGVPAEASRESPDDVVLVRAESSWVEGMGHSLAIINTISQNYAGKTVI